LSNRSESFFLKHSTLGIGSSPKTASRIQGDFNKEIAYRLGLAEDDQGPHQKHSEEDPGGQP
jgi:hypothetical protein